MNPVNNKRRLEIEKRKPITVLIAANWEHARWWCYNTGNMNPRDRNLIIITSVEGLQRARGLSLVHGYDRLVEYSWPTDRNFSEEAMHYLHLLWRETF